MCAYYDCFSFYLGLSKVIKSRSKKLNFQKRVPSQVTREPFTPENLAFKINPFNGGVVRLNVQFAFIRPYNQT